MNEPLAQVGFELVHLGPGLAVVQHLTGPVEQGVGGQVLGFFGSFQVRVARRREFALQFRLVIATVATTAVGDSVGAAVAAAIVGGD